MHNDSGYIVDGLGEDGWRWGYGMFAVSVSEKPCQPSANPFSADSADHYARGYGTRPDGAFLGGHQGQEAGCSLDRSLFLRWTCQGQGGTSVLVAAHQKLVDSNRRCRSYSPRRRMGIGPPSLYALQAC